LLFHVKNYDVANGEGLENVTDGKIIMFASGADMFSQPDFPVVYIFLQLGYNQLPAIEVVQSKKRDNLLICCMIGISSELSKCITSDEMEERIKSLAQAWDDPRALYQSGDNTKWLTRTLFSSTHMSYSLQDMVKDLDENEFQLVLGNSGRDFSQVDFNEPDGRKRKATEISSDRQKLQK
jgi:hypothetical protein